MKSVAPTAAREPADAAANAPARGDGKLTIAEFEARYLRHCDGFAQGDPCEQELDVEGDGVRERAVRVRDRVGARDGLAIRWADGSTMVFGAGSAVGVLATDVFEDGVDESPERLDASFSDYASCVVAMRRGRGFAGGGPREFPAVAPTGDGIRLDGGDAAAILYWDGARWRLLVLGF